MRFSNYPRISSYRIRPNGVVPVPVAVRKADEANARRVLARAWFRGVAWFLVTPATIALKVALEHEAHKRKPLYVVDYVNPGYGVQYVVVFRKSKLSEDAV